MGQHANDCEYEVFEAHCGVVGELRGICDEEAPLSAIKEGVVVQWDYGVPCTRADGHAGDHVACHTSGAVLARWPKGGA